MRFFSFGYLAVLKIGVAFSFLVFLEPLQAMEVDISDLKPGQHIRVNWNGNPVGIYRRTTAEIEELPSRSKPFDPAAFLSAVTLLARNRGNEFASLLLVSRHLESTSSRSLREDVFVYMDGTTGLSCILGFNYRGAFLINGCSDQEFDHTGRLLNVEETGGYHVLLPPHRFEGETLVLFDDVEVRDFSPDIRELSLSDPEKFIEALMWNKQDLALEMLRSGSASAEYRTAVGGGLIHIAAFKGTPAVVSEMVERGHRLNLLTQEGYAPVHLALMTNRIANVRVLVNAGADLEGYCENSVCMPSLEEFVEASTLSEEVITYLKSLRD